MRCRWIALLSILAFLPTVERTSASSGWKPVTHEELKISATDIGDPNAEAAILFREGELNDNTLEGTSLKVYIRIKIFDERGRRHADVQLPYRAELGRISDVHARTIRPDGSVVEVEGRDIFDKLLVKTGRNAWRAVVFSLPAVEVGSIIEYRYRQSYPQGFRYFALELQSELFIKELRYHIRPQAASGFDVRWVTFNAPDPKRFAPTWDGTYNIRVEDIPPFHREPFMPPELAVKIWGWLYYSNETETDPDKYWRNYARRQHLRASDETRPTGTIRRIVETITLSTDGPQRKIERIYDYVRKEIQNTGVREEGEADAGLKRNDTADETIRRRYGTPREINRLFIAMLRAGGLDARVAELTMRDEAFFHRSFPDAFQFNSEVTAVIERDGSVRFYDPGTPYCPPTMLSWEKEAVSALVYGKDDRRFAETPVTEAAYNNENRAISVTAFADGEVDVRVDSKITGQRALELRNELGGRTPDARREYIMAGVRDFIPLARLDEPSVVISNLSDTSAPLESSISYRVPQFITRTEKRLLLRPALLSHRDESLTAAPRRSNAMYFHYPWSESERVTIKLPDGYVLEQLPDPVEVDIGAARYQSAFIKDGDQVVYERRLMVNAISFTVEQYQTIKSFFDRVHQADRAVVSFKQ
ncbi:MAG: DUF3857 domain-containing protein [Blastocatellia bacterium]|nr:DUF3857 domain-containing protein [Blastocatellia bacterium]